MKETAIALVLLLLAPFALAEEENLLANGSFEKELDGWMFINNSGRGTAEVDRKSKRHGKVSLRVAKTGGMPMDVLRTNLAGIPAGGTATVSALVSGKNVGNAFLKFFVYDAAGNSLVNDVDITRINGNVKWKKVVKTWKLPDNAASAAIMLAMVLGGEVWLDDIRVTVKGGKPAASVTPAELDEKTRKWLDRNAVKVKSLDFDEPFDDLAPLKKILKNARIVQLGEQSHGDGSCFLAKARLARFLHQEMGFEVIAFESGLFECDRANALLGDGKVREAMFASVFGIWRVEESRPLFEYMAKTAKTDRPLMLAGFDVRGSGEIVSELPERVAAFLGDEKALTEADRAAFAKIEGIINEREYKPDADLRRRFHGALAKLREIFEEKRAELVERHGERETELMSRSLENYRLREEFEVSRNDESLGRWGRGNLRDGRMADNLRWLAEVHYPKKKIVCWGASMHLMHGAQGIMRGEEKPYEGCRQMGEIVSETFGKKAYTIGFAAHSGQKGTPFWGPFPIPASPPGSVEDTLHRYGSPLLFVNFRKKGPFHEPLSCGPLGYARDLIAVWPDVFDGLFFTDVMRPSTAMR